MTRHPTRGRERPAWRTALATERWIESRASVRISILTCPDGESNATLTPGPWRQPTLGRRDSDWRLAGGRGIRRDFGGISGGRGALEPFVEGGRVLRHNGPEDWVSAARSARPRMATTMRFR